jgi:arsenate reductase
LEERTYNVLFVCTGNSARSILAEALLNHLGRGRFKGWSAGSHPSGQVNPLTLQTLEKLRLPADGYRSKSWEEFAQPNSPHLDFVFTVCDQAAGEMCPVWPGQPMTAHWGVPDPAAFAGPAEKRGQEFMNVAITLKRRIELMLALPIQRLDAIALQRQVRDIGKQ